MRASSVLLALCAFCALSLASSLYVYNDPCHNTYGPYKTGITSVQGVWKGSCTQMNVPINASDPNSASKCGKAYSYPYWIAFNQTSVGLNIANETTIPVGAVPILASTPIHTISRVVEIDLFGDLALTHVTVFCNDGLATYQEASIHRLAAPNAPTTFPFPQLRDTYGAWCNSKDVEHDENAAASFNVLCVATRLRDFGSGWDPSMPDV